MNSVHWRQKRFGFRSRTHFTNSFHLSLRFFHFRVELLHPVDEKRRGQLIGVILRQKGFPPALGARKGAVGPGSEGQLSDALLAVVVEAREDLGFAEVLLTNGASDLLLQLFQPLLYHVRSFRHHAQLWAINRLAAVADPGGGPGGPVPPPLAREKKFFI